VPKIALSPAFNPETVEAREATPAQLYDALDAWNWQRHYGRQRSEEATQFRSVANPILEAIRSELRRRKLPTKRPQQEPKE
jgi:hypothetical protein